MLKFCSDAELILASSSPRRFELLRSTGLSFKVVAPEADETALDEETPQSMVERLALLKAEAVAAQFPDAWVIGADTTVFIDRQILGKPRDPDEAREMLNLIQSRTHSVWGAFALLRRSQRLSCVESHLTRVEMVAMDQETILNYVASGEPMDKAGAYAIQGYGTHLVKRIEGSYTNVVGLNLAALLEMIKRLGIIEFSICEHGN